MNNFLKGMIFGMLGAVVFAIISIPDMDMKTQKRVQRGCRSLCNKAENMYDTVNCWMR